MDGKRLVVLGLTVICLSGCAYDQLSEDITHTQQMVANLEGNLKQIRTEDLSADQANRLELISHVTSAVKGVTDDLAETIESRDPIVALQKGRDWANMIGSATSGTAVQPVANGIGALLGAAVTILLGRRGKEKSYNKGREVEREALMAGISRPIVTPKPTNEPTT